MTSGEDGDEDWEERRRKKLGSICKINEKMLLK